MKQFRYLQGQGIHLIDCSVDEKGGTLDVGFQLVEAGEYPEVVEVTCVDSGAIFEIELEEGGFTAVTPVDAINGSFDIVGEVQ